MLRWSNLRYSTVFQFQATRFACNSLIYLLAWNFFTRHKKRMQKRNEFLNGEKTLCHSQVLRVLLLKKLSCILKTSKTMRHSASWILYDEMCDNTKGPSRAFHRDITSFRQGRDLSSEKQVLCITGFFWTFGKKLKAKKTQNSREKLKTQDKNSRNWKKDLHPNAKVMLKNKAWIR